MFRVWHFERRGIVRSDLISGQDAIMDQVKWPSPRAFIIYEAA
uniref:Uncharacterized protein n=1 Tax=Micrococcus phage Kurnik TaxID=3092208 RepID=A0AAU6R623_9CAUD